MAMSAKARGKKRALDVEDNETNEMYKGNSNGVMDLDSEYGSNDDEDDFKDTPVNDRVQGASNGTDYELGGSISRSARMRATTTDEEEGGNESNSSDDEGSTSASDHLSSFGGNDSEEEIEQELLNKAYRTFNESRGLGNGPGEGKFVTASAGEAYLHAMARPAKTSNKKLSEHLSRGRPFTQSAFLEALNGWKTPAMPTGPSSLLESTTQQQEETLLKIEKGYSHLFSQWDFEMKEGFSVFLYGLGSKARILNRFVQDFLRKQRKGKGKGKAVIINGYMATLGLDDVLSALENIVFPHDENENESMHAKIGKSGAKLDERAKDLVEQLRKSATVTEDQPIYLLINNIDGVALQSYRAQAIMSLLAFQPKIRLLATVDHIKAPLLFPASISSSSASLYSRLTDAKGHSSSEQGGYNILWHHVPTYQPYTTEVLASGTMASLFPSSIFLSDLLFANGMQGKDGLAGASSESRAKAAWFVLASLTQKAKDLFALLSEQQISLCESRSVSSKKSCSLDPERTPATATLYSSLLSLARDKFLANNVNQFEALLREFRDHQIVLSGKAQPEDVDVDGLDAGNGPHEEVGSHAGEWVWVAIEREDLEALLDRMKG